MPANHYTTLGISKNASDEELQKAYRKLARKYHPDLNPDDKAAKDKFQEIQAAFDVLNDSDKRKMYDQYGSNYEHMSGSQPSASPWGNAPNGGDINLEELLRGAGGPFGGDSGGSAGGFADLFKQFGGGGRQTQPAKTRGTDLDHELTVPFNTAVLGGEAAMSVQRASGKVENIELKIPIGIDDGKKIRLRGQGEPSRNGGPAGDILVTIRVAPHPNFQRRGKRLDVIVPITLGEAAEGAKIDVPTPKGTITLTIPSGTSSGKKLRIKGHGVQSKSETPGDLYAEIQIVLPSDLTEDEAKKLADISKKHDQKLRENLRW